MNNKNSIGEKLTSGFNMPYWVDSVDPIVYETLKENISADVVIVGGGLAGVSVAYNLILAGKKVVLVEDGFIGSGESGRTTGHLVTALDDRYYKLQALFGDEKTRLIAQSHKAAIDFVEDTVRKEKIDCDFERLDGYLFPDPSDDTISLRKEYEACTRAGLDVTEMDNVPGLNFLRTSLKFSNQAQFHCIKYLKALCEIIIAGGGRIFTATHATDISEKGIVTEDGFKAEAAHVVIATNTPVNNKYVIHLKQYAYRTYVIGAKIKKGSLPHALWWDTGNKDVNENIPPYHYVRLQSLDDTHDLLLIGGEDHHTGALESDTLPEERRYKLLEVWARGHFNVEEIIYKWSGQVMEPMDSIAYIGRNPADKNNIYIVTGDSGNGMTHCTIAGILIKDLILGKENEWEKIYDPSRFKLFTAGKIFFREVLGGLINYYKNKPDRLKTRNIMDIQRREGNVVELSGKRYGIFRDESDNMHFVQAQCAHLGCIVKWNRDEKSWDCPCHGSRYTYEGKVINGPANHDLLYHCGTVDSLLKYVEEKIAFETE